MIEFIFLGLAIIVIALIYYAPNMRGRGHYDPTEQRLAEANTSITFLSEDEDRAAEYEHRFSGTEEGKLLDRRGYRVRKRK
ncbi:MAG: hypothetical protein ACFFDV_09365 [Candidatus Thorarchaeota archaeon]